MMLEKALNSSVLTLLIVFANNVKLCSSMFDENNNINNRINKKTYYASKYIVPQLTSRRSPRVRSFTPDTDTGRGTCLSESAVVVQNIKALQKGNEKFLDEDGMKTYCLGFGDATDVKCDFSRLNDEEVQTICDRVGGKVILVSYDTCDITMSMGGFGVENTFEISKIEYKNFPQCAGMSCDEESLLSLIDQNNEQLGMKCPVEDENNEFAHKYDGSNVTVKTCHWLKDQPDDKKEKYCSKKQYQIYKDGYKPASRVCPVTCHPYNCVEEKKNAKYLSKVEMDGRTGLLKDITSQCKSLSSLPKHEQMVICNVPPSSKSTNGYGSAKEVCTTSCPNSCKMAS
jgi:hypothetical protein